MMRLQPMNDTRPGQTVQCAKCHKMIDGNKALADMDAPAGTFYHSTCLNDDTTLAQGRRWFEYHCYEGEDSSDAELWHHTHQLVKVVQQISENDTDTCMYSVVFSDGFFYDVFDDEVLTGPDQFERPDYQRGITK